MTPKYHIFSRILHWFMALLIFTLLGLGIYMAHFLPEDAANKFQIFDLHKSLGVVVLIFIFVRIVNRFIHPAPALPQDLPQIEKFASHAVHIALYALMILVPLSGYLMSNSYGFPVHLFSITMPNLMAANPQIGKYFAEAHEIFAYSLLAAVGLHFAGALKHRFFDKPENDVLNRMI